ncbi:MAG TPA: DUF1800 domain-containing protein [Gemmataceae bacterium]|nr:DUF1800 domain-containing protein [Gemmataceae bacterium]
MRIHNEVSGSWDAYKPSTQVPWTLRHVVHLHRRAGFAATWDELQRDLSDGPGPSIDRILAGKSRLRVPDDFAGTADLLAGEALRAVDTGRLKAWWVYRMLWGPDPLGEKLTLVWHNHFATSNAKIGYPTAMWRQNQLFRKYGRGPFGELLKAVVHDPALLLWLDAPVNRKGRPNENLAREVMELFTLGIGNYSERDVKEAARALTGWDVVHDSFRESASDHDLGEKTILGHTGRWKGDDLVRILLEHPATARRLAWRLCQMLMGEDAVDEVALDALATGLRTHDLDIGWGAETILRSQAFFDAKNMGNRILGPVEYALGSAHALEYFDPPPSGLVLAEWTARLGQDLFYPPNVGGWPGGRHWLSPRAIIGRANFAAALVEGNLSRPAATLDWAALALRHGKARDLDSLITFYGQLLTGTPPSSGCRKRLQAVVGPKAGAEPKAAARAVALLLASPEMQLT